MVRRYSMAFAFFVYLLLGVVVVDITDLHLCLNGLFFDPVLCDGPIPSMWKVYSDSQDSVSLSMSDLLEYFICIMYYNIIVITLQIIIGLIYLFVFFSFI